MLGVACAFLALTLGVVTCDPGPAYWASWALAPVPAVALCVWAAITARPRGVLSIALPAIGGLMSATVCAVYVAQTIDSAPDVDGPERAERCTEEGPA